jgi:D-alanyl-D-alanine carboxypeptidase/D-alanyl-D-alanine-endopeptidase (penicillin-binding protein 4)
VVLVGGGDPTLSSLPADSKNLYTGAASIDTLAEQVKSAMNGQPVTQVRYDISRYVGDPLAPGWSVEDVSAGYITPISSLMMDGGRNQPLDLYSPRTTQSAKDTATALAKRLGVSSVAPATGPSDLSAPLGEVKSPTVRQLVEDMMLMSDNVLAETLGREIALATNNPASFAGAVTGIRDTLAKNGFDTTGAEFVDASGLSDINKIPAKLLAEVLTVAAKLTTDQPQTAKLRPLLTGLPVAGASGTLADRYNGATAGGKGWVRAKTGTLTGVNSLAGVVIDTDGRLLVFVFMSLSNANTTNIRTSLDALALALRQCGCR